MAEQAVRLFALGIICITPGAIEALLKRDLRPEPFITRHANCDWGDLDDEDRKANREALLHGTRIFSSYKLDATQKLWIITEADRSATTILFPEEY